MKHFPVAGLLIVMTVACAQRGSSNVDRAQPVVHEEAQAVDTEPDARPSEPESPEIEETAPVKAADVDTTRSANAVGPGTSLPECPHSVPRDASSCVPPDHAACTYTGTDPDCRTRIATCRDGRWRVECMP